MIGNDFIDAEDIRNQIATRASLRFLGLFPGSLYDYEVFDGGVLERDLQRIERYYRARGFYQAKVRAGRVFYKSRRQIAVAVVVEEGMPSIVRRLDLHGIEGMPKAMLVRAQALVNAKVGVGMRFEEAALMTAEVELLTLLGDLGFAFATVHRAADVDLVHNSLSVGFWFQLGALTHLGEVRI